MITAIRPLIECHSTQPPRRYGQRDRGARQSMRQGRWVMQIEQMVPPGRRVSGRAGCVGCHGDGSRHMAHMGGPPGICSVVWVWNPCRSYSRRLLGLVASR